MSSKKKFQKWFTYFDSVPQFPGSKGQWQVKEDTNVQTPVCSVPDPIGGERDSCGLNPRQRANALLISVAPELLEMVLRLEPRATKRDKIAIGALVARIEGVI